MKEEVNKPGHAVRDSGNAAWKRCASGIMKMKLARIVMFTALFATILILNLATALAYYQSHNLSEVRIVDTNLDMNDYNITNVSRLGVGTTSPDVALDVD